MGRLLYAAVAALIASNATAQELTTPSRFWSSATLYEKCSMARGSALARAVDGTSCDSYIAGVMDGLNATRVIVFHGTECATGDTTLGHIKVVFMAYLDVHPESRDVSAAITVITAVTQAFRCGPQS